VGQFHSYFLTFKTRDSGPHKLYAMTVEDLSDLSKLHCALKSDLELSTLFVSSDVCPTASHNSCAIELNKKSVDLLFSSVAQQDILCKIKLFSLLRRNVCICFKDDPYGERVPVRPWTPTFPHFPADLNLAVIVPRSILLM
jgi:hypothetical protein